MTDVYEIAQELLDTRKELEQAEEAQAQIPLLEDKVARIPALVVKLKGLKAALFAGPLESDTEVRELDAAFEKAFAKDIPEQPITTVIDATEDEVEDDPYFAAGAFAQ